MQYLFEKNMQFLFNYYIFLSCIIHFNMKIHFIGIGGIGMSALAQCALKGGHTVSGSDITPSSLTEELTSLGATVTIGHDADNVKDAQMCVYTRAVKENNAEYAECVKRGIKLVPREKMLSSIFNASSNAIAVAGSHGKTTTCGLILSALEKAGKCPTAFIGGVIEGRGNFIAGSEDIVIAEACEYMGGFLTLIPKISVILNVDLDHVDYYKQQIDLERAFTRFAANTRPNGTLIVNGDVVPKHITRYAKAKTVTYGFNQNNHFYAENIRQSEGQYSFDCFLLGEYYASLTLSVKGRHNIYNALAAMLCASVMSADRAKSVEGIAGFSGAKRRWSLLDYPRTNVVEDYAHHPSEIRALIETAKLQGYERITAFFQPHTYTRTERFWNDFVSCFTGIDKLVLLPIYAAREAPIEGITSQQLAKTISDTGLCDAEFCGDFLSAAKIIESDCGKDDLVLIIGAGDINKLGEILREKGGV